MKEQWVPVYVKEFSDSYLVSNKGKVYSIRRKKFMTPSPNNVGALQVHFSNKGKIKSYLINRLVYFSFKEIKDNKKIKDKQNFFVKRNIVNPYSNELNNLYLYKIKSKL